MSKERRPTIPIGEWRIALNLSASKAVQGHPSTPTYGCECQDCKDWAEHWHEVMPTEIAAQLERLGIDPARPADVYGGYSLRVSYHVVGQILTGPDPNLDLPEYSTTVYREVRSEPAFYMIVARNAGTFVPGPPVEKSDDGELILIDFRLSFPYGQAARDRASDAKD